MCFYMQQKDSILKVQKRFNATVHNPEMFLQSDFINGFDHLPSPIILKSTPQIISTHFSWGLLPYWSKDIDFRNNTLNARLETISEKPSFREIINNRCLVIATAFYEWHWLDEKGSKKQPYIIYAEEEIFAMAGLYSDWINPQTGEIMFTFTIVTTEANAIMQYIHNHKKRMPIILKKEDENAWLDSSNHVKDFGYPYSSNLVAFPYVKT